MKANTALGLIAAGGALGLHGVHRGEWWWARLMSRLCAVFVMVLAGATLVEYVSGGDLGIDEMLVDAPAGAVGTIHPGRMAPLAMVTFELYGISLLAAGSVRRHWQVFSAALALPATVVSIVVLLGYVFGAPELYAVSGRFSAVAANTSIALFLLGGGILFANPPAGPLRSLASPNLGGMMLRRMLPVAIVLPTAVEWIRLIAQSAGLFNSAEFGAASVAVAMMISMAGLLIWYAGVLDRLDGARRRGEEQHQATERSTQFEGARARGGEQGTSRFLLFDVARAAGAVAGDPRLRPDRIGRPWRKARRRGPASARRDAVEHGRDERTARRDPRLPSARMATHDDRSRSTCDRTCPHGDRAAGEQDRGTQYQVRRSANCLARWRTRPWCGGSG